MDIKKDILWRVYVCFIALTLFGIAVLGKVVQLQYVDGAKWRSLGDSLYKGVEKRPAERGTIYSDNNEMLSSSIPFFDVHIDYRTPALRAKKGKLFYENIDTLSLQLNQLFNDKTKAEYKQELVNAFKQKDPYYELKKHLSYQQYFKLRKFKLANLHQYKGGFIIDVQDERINPFGLMANRTIGLSRNGVNNVGLESYYDSILRGQSGSRLVQYIAGGVRVPINGSEIEPVNGNNIVTTLNVQMQDIAQNALHKMIVQNEALTGTAIVMEVGTGKIKAIANLGRQANGDYYEDNNYALIPAEPGSTIKLVTLMAALEEGVNSISSTIPIGRGYWQYGNRGIQDAEAAPKAVLTYKEAFAHSSNVAMAKIAVQTFAGKPNEFLKYHTKMKLNTTSGIDLNNPYKPLIKTTKSTAWSNQTIASMGFGYELRISPLQVLTMYNAIANGGTLMQPMLVSDIMQNTTVIKHINPTVLTQAVCSKATVQQLQECMEAVCTMGTARKVFDSCSYTVAGKTGTAEVSDGVFQYADGAHLASFVGYFPAHKPRFSCIVTIKCKPNAKEHFGGAVAAPVFKEIADQLVSISNINDVNKNIIINQDSSQQSYKAATSSFIYIAKNLQLPYTITGTDIWSSANYTTTSATINTYKNVPKQMPNVVGLGLKDALYCLESKGIKVIPQGSGRVVTQSIAAGTLLNSSNKLINLLLN